VWESNYSSLGLIPSCLGTLRGRVSLVSHSACGSRTDFASNIIAPDSEAVFYGVLDFLAKPVFGALLLWGHRNIDPARLGLAIKDYDGDASVHEKRKPVSSVQLLPLITHDNKADL
jgi:hypothetical protein